ncbi:Histidine kinase [Georgenia satyanarayanai]|uniref:histidine kinase n=1 Tax=Georgenia satyanarayanai TaxID=860221 RepID=A0A2Y9ABD0_9MICO|nr:histidine kinase [Georgenia satyanarayanai]PYG00466.1 histidine kinase [Georgenia satyanarayanai]SSA39849.1 Histidine kinase [Georgenia satyanarayanai]
MPRTVAVRPDLGRLASEVPGVALGGAAALLGVAGTAMFVAARPVLGEDALFLVVDATVALVYGLTSALVLSRRRHVVGYLLAVAALGGGLSAAAGGWRVLATARGLSPEPFASAFSWAWVPGTLGLFLVVPWLVRQRPADAPWWGPTVGATIAVTTAVLSVGLHYTAFSVSLGAAVVWGLVTAAGVERRRRRAPAPDAVGLGWLALGTLVLAVSFVPLLLPLGWVPLWLTPALHLVSQALFPAAVLAVVLRQRLWGIEVAVSRTVLAGALTVGLSATYLLATVLLSGVVPGEGWAQTLAAAAVVVAVQPSRLWLEPRVHRLVYGAAGDPSRVAARMGGELGRADGRLLDSLVESVRTALRLESVAARGEDGTVLATAGTATAEPTALPLAAAGGPVGTLLVTARPGEVLDGRTRRALDELSAVVAAGLLLRRTADELARTRERLTRARLQERQVIRRELHDGLGPSLAGLRLGLSGVANLVGADPEAARTMLAALQEELDRRVEDVRVVARTLLPPVLEELGLEPALRELVTRHAESGFTVRLHADVPGALPAPVAAAAYGIAAEAVLNAARHSGAGGCDVEVGVDGAGLRVVCRDGGGGRSPGAPAGVGTHAMRERAEELGGSLRIDGPPGGGTVVEALLPLAPALEESR